MQTVKPQNGKGMTVAEYLRRRDKIQNTMFVIKPTGESCYVIADQEVDAREFKEAHMIPFSLHAFNDREIDPDPRRRWMRN